MQAGLGTARTVRDLRCHAAVPSTHLVSVHPQADYELNPYQPRGGKEVVPSSLVSATGTLVACVH